MVGLIIIVVSSSLNEFEDSKALATFLKGYSKERQRAPCEGQQKCHLLQGVDVAAVHHCQDDERRRRTKKNETGLF